MNVLITGASSGIGCEMAKLLCSSGNVVYGIARRQERLDELKNSLGENFVPVCADISSKNECLRIYNEFSDKNIDILKNNAGPGIFRKFLDTDLNKELDMISLNISSVHILTKLFLKNFVEKDRGYIMNVSSAAGFMMGPLFSSYYASKAYVLRLTQAIKRELTQEKSSVHICALCPGPVKTEFDKTANVKNSFGGLDADYVAKYALKMMFKGKTVIIPSFTMKASVFFSKHMPDTLLSKITYFLQRKKL